MPFKMHTLLNVTKAFGISDHVNHLENSVLEEKAKISINLKRVFYIKYSYTGCSQRLH